MELFVLYNSVIANKLYWTGGVILLLCIDYISFTSFHSTSKTIYITFLLITFFILSIILMECFRIVIPNHRFELIRI